MYSKDVDTNTSLKLHAFMRANFIALDSRVDGGASISWKLLNTFRLLILVGTAALVGGCLTGLPIEMVLHSECHSGMCHSKMLKLMPKLESTDKLTPVTTNSHLKKCMNKTLTQQKLLNTI